MVKHRLVGIFYGWTKMCKYLLLQVASDNDFWGLTHYNGTAISAQVCGQPFCGWNVII